MKRYFSIKAFAFGVATAVVSYTVFMLITLTVGSETKLRNRMNRLGFPYAFYEWGGDPYVERFVLSGAIKDAALFIVYSIIVGMLFSFLWKVQTTQYGE
ncbi:MAG: hypothetical protein IPN69_20715 [Acidobacteria bacterium]|nr:hypothetical protein [Acidobacteriota bacterium]